MGELQEASFGRLVVRRAWFSAWGFFESWRRDVAVFAFSTMVGGGVFYAIHGWPDEWSQIVDVIISIVAPTVALWVLLFLWHLWLAPSALAYEAARSIALNTPSRTLPAPREPRSINWAPWRAMSKYAVRDLAKILARTDPGLSQISSEASAFETLILDAIRARKIPYIPEYGESFSGSKYQKSIDDETTILKAEALKWAEANSFYLTHIK